MTSSPPPTSVRTHVAIVGAGPAGLVLANVLHDAEIDHVLVEQRSEADVRARRRAGLLEARSARILEDHGLAEGMNRHGAPVGAVEFLVGSARHRIDYGRLTGVTNVAYQQHDLVGELIGRLAAAGGDVRFDHGATAVELEPRPRVLCTTPDGAGVTVEASVIAGCDGFHGAARRAAAAAGQVVFSHDHRTTWLTILAAAPPVTRSNIYAPHPRGFAGQMMRTEAVTRYYLQVPAGDTPADWPAPRLWDELEARLEIPGARMTRGEVLEVTQLDMGVSVGEPMQFGPLYLLGDAAHVITPCGGKGMNLAIQDADDLARAIVESVRNGDDNLLRGYSERRLGAAWSAQQFSNELLDLVNIDLRAARTEGYGERVRQAALARLAASPAAQREFGERYAGAEIYSSPPR